MGWQRASLVIFNWFTYFVYKYFFIKSSKSGLGPTHHTKYIRDIYMDSRKGDRGLKFSRHPVIDGGWGSPWRFIEFPMIISRWDIFYRWRSSCHNGPWGKKTNNNNTLIFLLHCSLVSQIHLPWRTQFIILPLPGWEIKGNKYICRHAYPHAYTQHRVYKRDHLRTREGQNLLFFLQVLRFISRDAWLAWNWLLITAFCICFLLRVFNILKKRQKRGKQVQRQGSLRDQVGPARLHSCWEAGFLLLLPACPYTLVKMGAGKQWMITEQSKGVQRHWAPCYCESQERQEIKKPKQCWGLLQTITDSLVFALICIWWWEGVTWIWKASPGSLVRESWTQEDETQNQQADFKFPASLCSPLPFHWVRRDERCFLSEDAGPVFPCICHTFAEPGCASLFVILGVGVGIGARRTLLLRRKFQVH